MPSKALEGTDKKKTRRKGSAGIDARGKSGLFTGAGGKKGAGKVKVTDSVSLAKAATGDSTPVNTRITRSAESFSPADRAAKRKADRDAEPQLGKTLAQIASGVGPGRTTIGAAISGGLSGAAVGATIGEEIHRANRAKKKKKDGQAKS
jgi:hypothetical protein